jgi:geranylgeranyl pyrophosphate synthase
MEQTKAPFFELVEKDMRQVEARMRTSPDEPNPHIESALNHLLASGGKRIRPTITLLTGSMLGADRQRLVTLAAAIELLHTATLVHDDLIDGSLLRRGNPTLNAQWSPAATVLTGDYVFARAAHLAAETGSLSLMRIFARTLMIMVSGEINQLFYAKPNDLHQDYFHRIYAKTASLFEVASQGAAMIAGESDGIIEQLRAFGYEIGIAFQIVDDTLDFIGQESEVGKPVASDLRNGLITLPAINFLQGDPHNATLNAVIAGRRVDEADLEELIEAIRQSDAIERSLDQARQFVASGTQRIRNFPDSPPREALIQLAEYVINRSF